MHRVWIVTSGEASSLKVISTIISILGLKSVEVDEEKQSDVLSNHLLLYKFNNIEILDCLTSLWYVWSIFGSKGYKSLDQKGYKSAGFAQHIKVPYTNLTKNIKHNKIQ